MGPEFRLFHKSLQAKQKIKQKSDFMITYDWWVLLWKMVVWGNWGLLLVRLGCSNSRSCFSADTCPLSSLSLLHSFFFFFCWVENTTNKAGKLIVLTAVNSAGVFVRQQLSIFSPLSTFLPCADKGKLRVWRVTGVLLKSSYLDRKEALRHFCRCEKSTSVSLCGGGEISFGSDNPLSLLKLVSFSQG